MRKNRKQFKWRFIYLPTGDVIKGQQLPHVLAHLAELLSTDHKREDLNAYDKARDLLFVKWGVSPYLSVEAVIDQLVEMGKIELQRRLGKKPGAIPYAKKVKSLDRNGALRVRILSTNTEFTIPDRSFLRQMLETTLYPDFAPSDKTLRFQLLSWCTLNTASELTIEQLLDLLIKRGILILEEIVYNGGHQQHQG